MSSENVAHWTDVVARWQRSGLTRGAFSQREGVNANTLSWWKWKLGSEESVGPAPALEGVRFVEIHPAEDDRAPVPPVVVVLGGYRVEVPVGFDGGTLAEVLRVLGECS